MSDWLHNLPVLLIAANDRPFTGQISTGPEPPLQIMPGAPARR